jgi:hypothetical protein
LAGTARFQTLQKSANLLERPGQYGHAATRVKQVGVDLSQSVLGLGVCGMHGDAQALKLDPALLQSFHIGQGCL